MKFLDQVKIYIKAGNGGDGSPSFRREKFIEYGGPDGGDGGNGGSIILKSERNLNTLIDYRYQQHHKAKRGDNGSGQNRTGKSGDDLNLVFPNPPLPPLATTNSSPIFIKSYINVLLSSSKICVPSGTLSIKLSPLFPVRF